MICPQCHATIEDGSSVCPLCHARIEDEAPRPSAFLFCDGCGARLSPQDRTCPKCGRPAPSILSTTFSASDLAAGKTASFPRLTHASKEPEVPHVPALSNARSVLDDALDPSATHVLDARDISASSAGRSDERRRRRPRAGVVIAIVAAVLIAGAVGFVAFDPFGVMPGIMASIQESAREMFPSRVGTQVKQEDADAADEPEEQPATEPIEDATLSDEAAYEKLHQAYEAVVSINDGDRFADAITAFNASYLDPSLDNRKEASAGAYALRDELQDIMDELDALQLIDGSAYADDRDNVRQLAEWMYECVDAICASWDVSLAVPEGEYPSNYQDEILAPMREAGSSALDNYYAHVGEWEPQEP